MLSARLAPSATLTFSSIALEMDGLPPRPIIWVKDGLVPEGEIEDMKADFQKFMNDEFEAGKDYRPNKADWLDGKWSHLDKRGEKYQRGKTAIAKATFDEVGRALVKAPDDFPLHKTVARLLEPKAKMFETGEGFDWATAATGCASPPACPRHAPPPLLAQRLFIMCTQS